MHHRAYHAYIVLLLLLLLLKYLLMCHWYYFYIKLLGIRHNHLLKLGRNFEKLNKKTNCNLFWSSKNIEIVYLSFNSR